MTIDGAQAELFKLLTRGSTGGIGLGSLLKDAAGIMGSDGVSARIANGGSGPGFGTSLLQDGLASGLTSGSSLGKGLLGFSPILTGLRALFGGGTQQALPELTRYVAPEALNLSLGLAGGGRSVGAVSYGQAGTPRLAPSVTVNVSAIDSKSFSDHSDAIARVVREAMLNSGALADVVGEI